MSQREQFLSEWNWSARAAADEPQLPERLLPVSLRGSNRQHPAAAGLLAGKPIDRGRESIDSRPLSRTANAIS